MLRKACAACASPKCSCAARLDTGTTLSSYRLNSMYSMRSEVRAARCSGVIDFHAVSPTSLSSWLHHICPCVKYRTCRRAVPVREVRKHACKRYVREVWAQALSRVVAWRAVACGRTWNLSLVFAPSCSTFSTELLAPCRLIMSYWKVSVQPECRKTSWKGHCQSHGSASRRISGRRARTIESVQTYGWPLHVLQRIFIAVSGFGAPARANERANERLWAGLEREP